MTPAPEHWRKSFELCLLCFSACKHLKGQSFKDGGSFVMGVQ